MTLVMIGPFRRRTDRPTNLGSSRTPLWRIKDRTDTLINQSWVPTEFFWGETGRDRETDSPTDVLGHDWTDLWPLRQTDRQTDPGSQLGPSLDRQTLDCVKSWPYEDPQNQAQSTSRVAKAVICLNQINKTGVNVRQRGARGRNNQRGPHSFFINGA